MRYLAVLDVTKQPSTPPPPALMEAIIALGEEATRAGVLLDTAGLAPSSAGARVAVADGEITITDGPFADTKEMISYALYDVRTKEEAVEWSRRFMNLHRVHWPEWQGAARVLRVMGPEDFGAAAAHDAW
ncbi:YciI family protein [Actinomadura viridis]|uniref:YCII-related domain-containing protein n=1 Tax=Actinomadura viridis TaxID=58110 RepID=A0A931DGF0_9ACTN|nr:YciI family protein [Actinomadura viridis]MBG6087026.1 hypothetical protein [Actinomadura viridis]